MGRRALASSISGPIYGAGLADGKEKRILPRILPRTPELLPRILPRTQIYCQERCQDARKYCQECCRGCPTSLYYCNIKQLHYIVATRPQLTPVTSWNWVPTSLSCRFPGCSSKIKRSQPKVRSRGNDSFPRSCRIGFEPV